MECFATKVRADTVTESCTELLLCLQLCNNIAMAKGKFSPELSRLLAEQNINTQCIGTAREYLEQRAYAQMHAYLQIVLNRMTQHEHEKEQNAVASIDDEIEQLLQYVAKA